VLVYAQQYRRASLLNIVPEVGYDNKDVVEAWPRLFHPGNDSYHNRECDEYDEDDVYDEQLIAPSDRIVVVRCWPSRIYTERYISHHVVALSSGRGVEPVEGNAAACREEALAEMQSSQEW
jgi:hypothetical protein